MTDAELSIEARVLAYGELLESMRLLLDAQATSYPSADVAREVAAGLRKYAEELEQWPVAEDERWRDPDPSVPGIGLLFAVPAHVDHLDDDRLDGRITFTRYYLGIGAAHGGALTLLFDELFGHLVNSRVGTMCRTASLTVDYEKITPIDVELRMVAEIERVERRKHFVTGALFTPDGERVGHSRGLFIAPRGWAGQ